MDKLSARSRILKGHRSAVVTIFLQANPSYPTTPSIASIYLLQNISHIGNLGFTEKEKNDLRKYFIGNKKRQNDVQTLLLGCTTNEEKLAFVKSLITPDLKSTLESNFDLIRSELRCIRSELGNIYEVSARLEVAKFSDSHYASNFEIFGLNGFIWLSLLRKKFLNEKPRYDSPIYIQAYRAEKLSKYINNKDMKNKLEESIAVIRSLPQDKNFIKILNTLADRAEKDLNAWEAHEKNSASMSENHLYLANTKFLGVMLITSYILDPKIAIENNHVFIFTHLRVLHLTSYLDMKNVSIEIGEIKLMTKNISHGYRQLLIRLASLRFVIKALNSKGDEVANYKCDLVGVLYVPKVPTINIPSSWEHGITFPKGTNHTIRIVVVAVKNIASLLT
ncbi:hypothetical protein RhiirA1_460486 [Rhizophagus irregularis]|uniref:Uncharacterized protein n=2 Tax=Rhizophagus irregularis TaxID=588596 RepID=A0A2N0RRE7_9GLOM|nr:hypothetical protein RhiirA1_460486 [Rhizophagus irregularis]